MGSCQGRAEVEEADRQGEAGATTAPASLPSLDPTGSPTAKAQRKLVSLLAAAGQQMGEGQTEYPAQGGLR